MELATLLYLEEWRVSPPLRLQIRAETSHFRLNICPLKIEQWKQYKLHSTLYCKKTVKCRRNSLSKKMLASGPILELYMVYYTLHTIQFTYKNVHCTLLSTNSVSVHWTLHTKHSCRHSYTICTVT